MPVMHRGAVLSPKQIYALLPLIRQHVVYRWSRQEFEHRVDLVLEAAGMPVVPAIEGELAPVSRLAIEGSAPCV